MNSRCLRSTGAEDRRSTSDTVQALGAELALEEATAVGEARVALGEAGRRTGASALRRNTWPYSRSTSGICVRRGTWSRKGRGIGEIRARITRRAVMIALFRLYPVAGSTRDWLAPGTRWEIHRGWNSDRHWEIHQLAEKTPMRRLAGVWGRLDWHPEHAAGRPPPELADTESTGLQEEHPVRNGALRGAIDRAPWRRAGRLGLELDHTGRFTGACVGRSTWARIRVLRERWTATGDAGDSLGLKSTYTGRFTSLRRETTWANCEALGRALD
jgi:hypothetical protein